jgi:uncharacterized protein with HEPN domain
VVRTVHARLYDIDQTITKLLDVSKGRTLAHLSNDWAFAQVCNYALQSIGEAINHLPPELLVAHPGPPWRKIIGMSHKLRHEYFRIDADVIWEVLTVHLRPLHATVKKMLADLDQPGLPL